MSRPISIHSKDTLISIMGYPVTRVSRFSYNPNLNSEQLWEAGNENFVENSYDDIITTAVSFENNDWGVVDNLQMALGVYSGTQNTGTVTEADFKTALTTFMVYERDKFGNLLQSVWIPGAYIDSFTFDYDARGIARESYDFTGGEERVFVGKYKYAKYLAGINPSGSTFTVNSLAVTQTNILYAMVNSQVIDATNITVTNNVSDSTIDISASGVTLGTNDVVGVVYYESTGSPTFLSTSGVGGIRGGSIILKLGLDQWLRVQSVSINGRIERDEVGEMGNPDMLAYDYNNMTIEVTVNALKSDLYEYAVIAGEGANWATRDTNGLILNLTKAKGNKLTLSAEIYDKPQSRGGTLLKTVTLSNLELSAKNESLDVPGRNEISFTLVGSQISVAGQGAVGLLSNTAGNWTGSI